MKHYISFANKLLFIIDKKISKILPLIFLFLFLSFIEILGIGLIIPFINLILNPENFNEIIFSNKITFETFTDKLILFSGILIIIFIIKTILSIYVRLVISKFAYEQYAYLQIKMLSLYQKMDYLDFTKRNYSDYTRNVKEMTSSVISAIEIYLRLVSELIIFVIIITYLCFVNFQVVVSLTLILGLIAFIFEYFLKPLATRYGKAKAEASSLIYQGIDNAIKGKKEIKILQKENFFLNILKNGADKVCLNETKQSLISNSPRYILELVLIIFLLSFLTILVLSNDNDIASVLPILSVFAVAGARLLPGSAVIIHSLNMLNYFNKATLIIYHDIKKLNKKIYKKNNKQLTLNTKKIIFKKLELKNIFFKYPKSRKYILNNISINLKAKDCIGIVGLSGSGKTTLMDLILGLIKPNKGKIFLNEELIDTKSKKWLEIVSYLPQESLVMEDTIKTNVSFDNNESQNNAKKIKFAIKKANIEKLIEAFPKKLNTKIGKSGVRLSGGQNKRIAIARTFFHDRQIIIMDEATSSLDIKTESLILDQLKILKKKKTIILITHNSNTLKYCDKIFRIKNGKITKI